MCFVSPQLRHCLCKHQTINSKSDWLAARYLPNTPNESFASEAFGGVSPTVYIIDGEEIQHLHFKNKLNEKLSTVMKELRVG